MLRVGVLVWASCLPSGAWAASAWDSVEENMHQLRWLGPFNLLVGEGTSVIANITVGGWSSAEKIWPIWSASKWASGAVFFNLDAEGILPLDTKVSDHLPWWTSSSEDARSKVTVRNLLDFDSGFGEHECVFNGQMSFDDCARKTYEEKFVEQKQGSHDYNEGHLQIAAAVALKATGMGDNWNRLWYERVGQPSGLPQAVYWGFPSDMHPGPGAGLTISSDDYAMFLSALQMSLSSKEQPTKPLKFGPGLDYGAKLLKGDWRLWSDVESNHYGLTSWHWENGVIESNACAGWLPAIVPETSERPGFWIQLARNGGFAFGPCIGSDETSLVKNGLVDYLIEAVKVHKSDSAAQPFHAVLADMKCERDDYTAAFCRCQDFSTESCHASTFCTSGILSDAACTAPFSTFNDEYFAVCTTCGGHGEDGDGEGHGSCAHTVKIPRTLAEQRKAKVCE